MDLALAASIPAVFVKTVTHCLKPDSQVGLAAPGFRECWAVFLPFHTDSLAAESACLLRLETAKDFGEEKQEEPIGGVFWRLQLCAIESAERDGGQFLLRQDQ